MTESTVCRTEGSNPTSSIESSVGCPKKFTETLNNKTTQSKNISLKTSITEKNECLRL